MAKYSKHRMHRKVVQIERHGMQHYALVDESGDIDVAWPVATKQPEHVGCSETVEIPAEFFRYISILQSRGVEVIFRI